MKRASLVLAMMVVSCGKSDSPPTDAPIIVASVDTLITTESAEIARLADLDVAPSGVLYAADTQANQLLAVNSETGEVTRLGRAGKGPGEFVSSENSAPPSSGNSGTRDHQG